MYFFSFCAFRRFATIEHIDEIAGQERRIDQIAFGAHGMGADTVNGNRSRTGVECFIDDFSESAAVYGIGEIDREFGKVHILRSEETTFFVGDKGDVDIAVIQVRMGGQGVQCRHDVGDGGFVICPRTLVPSVVISPDRYSRAVPDGH